MWLIGISVYLLNTSEMKFSDQSRWNKGTELNEEQAPSSKDQFEDTFPPHQNVSAKHVTTLDATTNPVTAHSACLSLGIVFGINLAYRARIENFGK